MAAPRSQALRHMPFATTAGRHATRVRGWLIERAPNFAPVYAATIRMAVDATFPGCVWFMAHALRDMRNRLPDAIAGSVKGSNTQYSDLAARVTKRWMEDGLPGVGSSPVTPWP